MLFQKIQYIELYSEKQRGDLKKYLSHDTRKNGWKI